MPDGARCRSAGRFSYCPASKHCLAAASGISFFDAPDGKRLKKVHPLRGPHHHADLELAGTT
jgi:hypothetical protein